MMQETTYWLPVGNVVDHSGRPLVAGRNFFAPPPAEIGTVLSAYSALRNGQSPDPVRKRLKITLIVAGVTALIGYILGALSDPKGIGEVLALGTILAAVFAIPAAIITFLIQYLFRRDYRCDYVGTEGIADYDLLDLRRGKPGSVLRFADATDMNITLTPQRIKGIQAATAYRYAWVDASGKEIFAISGEYYAEQKFPEDKFHFASAAEATWAQFRQRRSK